MADEGGERATWSKGVIFVVQTCVAHRRGHRGERVEPSATVLPHFRRGGGRYWVVVGERSVLSRISSSPVCGSGRGRPSSISDEATFAKF